MKRGRNKPFILAGALLTLSGLSGLPWEIASPTAHADVLSAYCISRGGELLDHWDCPASGRPRSGAFCRLRNVQGQALIFNGCTGVKGKYAEIFFAPCTLHDFCYHNEPGATGKQKKDCDDQFFQNMKSVCQTLPAQREQESCERKAKIFSFTVNNFGNDGWTCSKENAAYPADLIEFEKL